MYVEVDVNTLCIQWLIIGLLSGFVLCPIFLWLGRELRKMLRD